MNNNIAINPIQAWLNNETVKRKFVEVLDKGANGFISSLLSLVSFTPKLKEADPKTVMAAAMTAATLKLPINPNLGLAYIVPYNNFVNGKKVMQAQFQMGWKGFVQLAERSGQYRTINTSAVYEGQIKDIDFITGEIIRGQKISDTVIGYVAYMELTNGFKKTLYMTREEMEHHAREFSKAYGDDLKKNKKSSLWTTNFDAMAKKTVLKLLISKYGIMSIDMQSDHMATAIASDQAIIHKVGEEYEYADNDETPEALEASHEDEAEKTIEQEEVPAPGSIDPETSETPQTSQEQELALS
jgi:recombination protein RecT